MQNGLGCVKIREREREERVQVFLEKFDILVLTDSTTVP